MFVNLKLELSILQNHIPLMENVCESDLQVFDLDPILKSISTPKPVLDLNQIPESVLISELLTLEPKSILLPYHIQLLDKDMQQYVFDMIFQD